MKLIIAFIIASFVSGCVKQGKVVTVSESEDSYNVTALFTVEGCKVFRFNDAGYKYFANCAGSVTDRVSCGKNCWRDESVTTAKDGAK